LKVSPNLGLTKDGRILFSTRLLRMFAYGLLSVILALYLSQLGLNQVNIWLFFTLTLLGDTIISLWITTHADLIGRQRMLICGAALIILAGLFYSITKNFYLLLIAAAVGVISPGGNEVGPFLSIEQASLTQLMLDNKRTRTFAWYSLVGSFSAAPGALVGGGTAQLLQN
jgi:MFS family permease